ncbi:TPA: hypothetical protein HA265_08210 [Candidatus Woesearchaeota archaeon]|nr:hypothetical protein [Candidatus Woesearchaeota archaeon]
MISIITETSPGLEDPEFSEEITEEELEKRVGSAPFIADSDKPLAYDEYADDKSIGISNSDGQNLPASTYEGHSRRKKALGWVGTVAALIGIAGSAILGYAGKKELKSEKPKKALDKSYLATPRAHEIVVDAGVSRDWKKIDPKGLLDAKVGTVPFTPAPVYDAGVPDASQSASVPQHDAAVPAPDASRAVSQPDASQAYVPPVAVRGPDASVPQHDAAPQAPDASAPQQDASVYIPPVQDASVPPADAAVKTAPPKVKTPVPDTKVPKVKAPKAPSIDGYCEFQQPKRYDSTAPNDFFGADSDTLLEQYVADMIRLAQKRGKTSITFYAHGGADPDAADGWDTAKTYNSKTLPWKRAQDGKRKVEKMAKKYAKGTGVQVTVHARSAGMLDLVHPDAEQVAYINKTTGAQRKAGTFGKWIDKAKGAYDKIFKRAARGRLLLVSTQDLSGMDHTQLEDRVKENPANKAYGPGCTDASSSTGSLDRSVPASYGPAKTKKTPVDRQDAPSQSLAYDVTTSDSAPMGPGLAAASLLADDVVSTMDFGGFPKDGQRSYGCASQSTPNDSTNAGIPIGIALAGLGLVALRHRKKDAPRPDYTAGNVDEDAPVPAMADVEGYADDYSIGRAVVGVTDRMVLSRPAPVMIQGIPAPTEYGGIADIDDHYESFEVSEYVEDLTDELEELVVRTEQDERRTMTASGVIDTGSSKDDYVLTDEAVNAEFDAFIRELDEADQPEVEYSLKNLPNLSVRKIAKADRITFNDLKGPKVKTKMYTFGQMSRIEELNEVKDCLSELGIDTSTTRYRFAEDEGTVEEALAMVREAVKESAAAARRPQPTVPATYYSLSDLDPSLAVDELNDVKRSLEAIGVKTDMPYRFAADTGSLDEVYEMLGMDPVKIRQRQEMYDPLKDEFPDMDRKAAKVYSSLQKINQEYRRTKELSEARRLTEEVEYERLTVEAEKAAPDCMDIPEPAVAYRDVVSGVIENAR